MIGNFIKKWFGKTTVATPVTIPKCTQFNIGVNSRISIDNSVFLAYDQYTVISDPGELVVRSVSKMCEYGVEVYDFHCVSGTNRAMYVVRIQQDQNTKQFINGHVFSLVQQLYPATETEWSDTLNTLRTANEWAMCVNEELYVSYLADMDVTYNSTQHSLDTQGNVVSFAKKLEGRDYCRPLDTQSTIFETCLVEVVDGSVVMVYAGIHLNPMGISVI